MFLWQSFNTRETQGVPELKDFPAGLLFGMRARYIVRPSPLGGYEITGPGLPFPIRYKQDVDAMNYGHHMLRATGGSVVALDSQGNTIVIESAPSSPDGLRA